MLTIYHNPRCSKSRGCNVMLQELGKDVKIINYTKDLFTETSLKEIIDLLKIKPIELVRTNEKEWKENRLCRCRTGVLDCGKRPNAAGV